MTRKSAEATYLRHQIRMVERRLAAINVATTRNGDDPKLTAESEALHLQLAALQVELRGALE